MPMELLTWEPSRQELKAISMEPLAHREAQSFEPPALHCSKKYMTCKMMSQTTIQMEQPTQEPFEIAMELPYESERAPRQSRSLHNRAHK
jgi:hypothetical protein